MKLEFKNFINLNEKEKIEILKIRNKRYIREKMSNISIIKKSNHLSWIKTLNNTKDNKYFAVISNNIIIGSVYFNINEKKEYFWGIYIDDNCSPILSSLSAYIFIEFLVNSINLQEIFSSVKKSNSVALNFNKNFGFEISKEDDEYFYLKLSKSSWENHKNTKIIKPIKKYLDKIEYYFE